MALITQAYAFCLKGPKTGKMAQKNLANTYKKQINQKNAKKRYSFRIHCSNCILPGPS